MNTLATTTLIIVLVFQASLLITLIFHMEKFFERPTYKDLKEKLEKAKSDLARVHFIVFGIEDCGEVHERLIDMFDGSKKK